MSFTPTAEQLAIVEFARTDSRSMLVNALAGAAKTSTLELICKALSGTPVLCLAFNKKIAEEMRKRLPGHVECATLNSLGHKIWAKGTSRRLVVDTKKTYKILQDLIADLPKSDRFDAFEVFGDTMRLVSQMKLSGVIPNGKFEDFTPVTTEDDFFEALDEPASRLQRRLASEALFRSIRSAYDGHIDFDDQIYMPTLFGGTFPRFPVVCVDEAQDLSALNHALLRKLVTGRLIAVGDPWQSIYGFRGAIASGMSKLQETFSMVPFTLSISFRCPVEVVKRAHFRTPHMRWAENAVEGHVETLEEWSAREIPDGAAIICRNNAPLFRCAFQLIKAGRGIKLVGSDIGPGLVKVLKKLGTEDLSQQEVFRAIERWESEATAKAKGKASVTDKADCLRVFAEQGPTLSAAVAYAEHLFKSEGPIQLLSGHKSKGLEFDTVYHLDPQRIPSPYINTEEEMQQELNLRYVILTRAKLNYYEVTLEGLSL